MTTPAEDARREDLLSEARGLATVIRHLRPNDEQWQMAAKMIGDLADTLTAERANSEGIRKVLREIKSESYDWKLDPDLSVRRALGRVYDIAKAALSASPSPTLPNTRMGKMLSRHSLRAGPVISTRALTRSAVIP